MHCYALFKSQKKLNPVMGMRYSVPPNVSGAIPTRGNHKSRVGNPEPLSHLNI
jgi:hypothetical protein